MNKNGLIRLIIDNREKELIASLSQRAARIHYKVRRLEIADVVVSEDVAVERKSGHDFITSIVDGRLFQQLLRMTDAYSNPILIVEGLDSDVFNTTGMNPSAIYGCLAYIAYRMKIAVIPTLDLEGTTTVIERIGYREQIKDVKPVLSRRVRKNIDIKDRRQYLIESLIDTGPTKAKTLIQRFETPHKVIEAIRNTKIIYTRTGNPKCIKGPLEDLQGFGCKFIQKNKTLLFGD
jgi:Fanconi anemia group M protein